jgi:hypothetical protein
MSSLFRQRKPSVSAPVFGRKLSDWPQNQMPDFLRQGFDYLNEKSKYQLQHLSIRSLKLICGYQRNRSLDLMCHSFEKFLPLMLARVFFFVRELLFFFLNN